MGLIDIVLGNLTDDCTDEGSSSNQLLGGLAPGERSRVVSISVSYQCRSCSPIVHPDFGFHQLSRPEPERYGHHSKSVGDYGDSIALGRFAPVNVDAQGDSGNGRHRKVGK